MSDPRKYFRNNVSAFLSFVEEVVEASVPALVLSSSCATYGDTSTLPIEESSLQKPVSPYGETKLFAERALHWLGAAHGLRYAVLRYFNAAGADPEGEIGEEHDPEPHLIPSALLAARGLRKGFLISGTDYSDSGLGTAIRDFVHV